MSSRNDRYGYRLATPADSSRILEIYESGSFSGQISVLYTRRPDPVQSLMKEGDSVIIPVMVDKEKNGLICGVGCCVVRNAWINGEIMRVGYLSGLKVHPGYRRRIPHIARAYGAFYQETKGRVDLYYTTILEENAAARKMLEKRRKGMPEYRPAGVYTVYCFGTGKKHRRLSQGLKLEKGNMTGVKAFYEAQLQQTNFAPAGTDLPGIRDNDFYTLRDDSGQVLAACAVWNQQEHKQYIITGYAGLYKILRHVPLSILGYPSLPRENIPANYASIALLCVKDHNPEWAAYLLGKVAEEAAPYDFLMAGLFGTHPLKPVFQNLKHIKYKSMLYTVHWEGKGPLPDDRPVHLEVGLL